MCRPELGEQHWRQAGQATAGAEQGPAECAPYTGPAALQSDQGDEPAPVERRAGRRLRLQPAADPESGHGHGERAQHAALGRVTLPSGWGGGGGGGGADTGYSAVTATLNTALVEAECAQENVPIHYQIQGCHDTIARLYSG